MPKRVLDFDAMWGSDKLAACAAWAQAEYAWLYGLADASGCFELTNLRVIWGRVAAIRRDFTIERLEQVFDEFHDKGLLFLWEENGKRYGHWTGSDVPGRLPPPSWRMRLERFAPPGPKQQLAEYMSRFARGRAASAGGAFLGASARAEAPELHGLKPTAPPPRMSELKLAPPCTPEDRGPVRDGEMQLRAPCTSDNPASAARGFNFDLKPALSPDLKPALASPRLTGRQATSSLEATQGQDWDLNLNWDREGERKEERAAAAAASQGSSVQIEQTPLSISSEQTETENRRPDVLAPVSQRAPQAANAPRPASPPWPAAPMRYTNAKELQVARELVVGQGPVCQPGQVKPEALERIRAREAARRRS